MPDQTIIFLFLGGTILILLTTNIVVFLYSYKTNKKIDELLEKGKIKDFKDIFLSQKEKNNGLEEKIKQIFLKINAIENINKTIIRKVGIVRYNPFQNMGGNQSFVIAMMDSKNNGFLISSLFTKEGNRVYAKTIKQGKSDYVLSEEENEAINKAIDLI